MAFEPRTAIVTGSDSGIGRATAVALAEAGLDVAADLDGPFVCLQRAARRMVARWAPKPAPTWPTTRGAKHRPVQIRGVQCVTG